MTNPKRHRKRPSRSRYQCSFNAVFFGGAFVFFVVNHLVYPLFVKPKIVTTSLVSMNLTTSELVETYHISNDHEHLQFLYSNYNKNNNASNPSTRIAIATIGFYSKLNELVVENHKQYAKQHSYDYLILRHTITDVYKETGPFGTQQRVMFIYKLLYDKQFEMNAKFKSTYDIVLWIDFDALFINDSITIEDIIDYSMKQYNHNMNKCYNMSYDSLSMILTGDFLAPINAGVIIFKKTQFLQSLLKLWSNIMIFCANPMNDQTSLKIALFGNKNIISKFSKILTDYDIDFDKLHNKSAVISQITNTNQTDLNSIQEYMEKVGEQGMFINKNSQDETSWVPGVTANQARYNHDVLMIPMYHHHVALIKQSKMNNNIWNQFNKYQTNRLMNQWIIHFAGQKQRDKLLQIFCEYKQSYLQNNINVNQQRNMFDCIRKISTSAHKKTFSKYWQYSSQHDTSMEEAVSMRDARNYALVRNKLLC